MADQLDNFDRAQLEAVLDMCAHSTSLSEGGRVLFAKSRARRASTNDADQPHYLHPARRSWTRCARARYLGGGVVSNPWNRHVLGFEYDGRRHLMVITQAGEVWTHEDKVDAVCVHSVPCA